MPHHELEQIEATIQTARGPVVASGWRFHNFPELAAVSVYIPDIYEYHVIHLPAGMVILKDVARLINALRAMQALTDLRVDWTQEKPVLDASAKRSLERIRRKFCGIDANPGE